MPICIGHEAFHMARQYIILLRWNTVWQKKANIHGVSAGKRDQIDKKFFFEITNILDQMIKFASILLKNFFFKKISIWSLFPALTPHIELFFDLYITSTIF